MEKRIFLGLLRISLGWVFLWAFLDKTFGLGFSTAKEKAWLYGGSPTTGFLTSAVKGPLADFYHNLAGNIFVDWLFMIGLLLIGVSLVLGIFNKPATYSGSLLLILMFSAVLPPSNNPFIDDHIIYTLLLIVLYLFNAGDYLGFRKKWIKTPLVRNFRFLE